MKWDKLLNLIGIERVTNRVELMDEISELPDTEFAALVNANSAIRDRVVELSCAECKAANNGRCVHGAALESKGFDRGGQPERADLESQRDSNLPGDDEYCGEYDIEPWLGRPWQGTKIITKEALHNG